MHAQEAGARLLPTCIHTYTHTQDISSDYRNRLEMALKTAFFCSSLRFSFEPVCRRIGSCTTIFVPPLRSARFCHSHFCVCIIIIVVIVITFHIENDCCVLFCRTCRLYFHRILFHSINLPIAVCILTTNSVVSYKLP